MIANERQYQVTKAAIRRFEQALAQNEGAGQQRNPRLHEVMREGVESELDSLRAEVAEYEAFRSGEITEMVIDSFNDLPAALIRARIAAGLTQKGLADLLGIQEQQIQRYEKLGYEPASFARLKEIMLALGLKVHIQIELPSVEERARLQDLDARVSSLDQGISQALPEVASSPRHEHVA